MRDAKRYVAVDLGASSGRVLVATFDGGRVELDEVHRFVNEPVRLPDGLRWNLLGLFAEVARGVRDACAAGPVVSVGVDAWGVDYALVDDEARPLGLPFHYRDARTDGMPERAFARVPRDELYRVTGIQTMPINTVFQLLADDPRALDRAAGILLVPGLVSHWLGGRPANDDTAASTTGLLDAATGDWARGVIARLGLPAAPFGPLVAPGTALGTLRSDIAGGATGVDVVAVAGHDTAAAFAAALGDDDTAVLSSGTWSLVGIESPRPVLSDAALAANLTNERGVGGTVRLLKNVMGLWLLQECEREWGLGTAQLLAEAEAADDAPLFDPDDPTLLAPGGMPARIHRLMGASPDRGATVRGILTSLACKYRWVLEDIEAVSGRRIRRIDVVGGGAGNALLARITADVTGRTVLAGPREATALGNALVQVGAHAGLDRSALRDVARVSAERVPFRPADGPAGDALYARFLDTTGLRHAGAPPTPTGGRTA